MPRRAYSSPSAARASSASLKRRIGLEHPMSGEGVPPLYRAIRHTDRFEPVSNYLFRNNGDGTFTDASRSSGIAASPGKGLGVAFADFDGDGRIDVSVVNDSHPQSLFRNNG